MSHILRFEQNDVVIGKDDNSIVRYPLSSLNYQYAKVGDAVEIFGSGDDVIISRADFKSSDNNSNTSSASGKVTINKHLFVWVFSFLFGGFGVDRFIRGQIGIGVAKLLFGWVTFGIWALVDWIIAMVKAYGSAYSGKENLTFNANGSYEH